MNQAVSRGLVLRVSDHGEADKLITLYSPDLGRASGIAKGAKKSKQRFVNKLEPFTLLEFTYRPPRQSSLLLISEAELETAHLSLRQQYPRYLAASYLAELLLKFTRESDPDPLLFELGLWTLHSLDLGLPPLKTLALFHLRLLELAGYGPQTTHCASCGRTAGCGTPFQMPAGSGDILCPACRTSRPGPSFTLTPGLMQFLNRGRSIPLALLSRLQLPEQSAAVLLRILYRYSLHLLQQDLHTWSALNSLNSRSITWSGSAPATPRRSSGH